MYSHYHTPQEIGVCWIALSHAVPKASSIEYVREAFSPIVWTEVGYRTPFLEEYCGDEPVKSAVLMK